MEKKDKIHLSIISIINFSLIIKLVVSAWNGNDKAIILVVFGYIALILINSIIWLLLKKLKRPENKIYKIVITGLALLFIPTVIIASLY